MTAPLLLLLDLRTLRGLADQLMTVLGYDPLQYLQLKTAIPGLKSLLKSESVGLPFKSV